MSIEMNAVGAQFRTQAASRRKYSVNDSLKVASDKIKKVKSEQDSQTLEAKLSIADTAKAVEEIQKICDMFDRKLQFRVNKDTNRVIIKVIDSNTEKVIREIPSEAIQKLQERLKEAAGFLFDEAV